MPRERSCMHACLIISASSSFYGYSMSLEQAIVRLGLCMFDFGGMWTSSFGRITPHLRLIPSLDACIIIIHATEHGAYLQAGLHMRCI